MEEDLKSQAEHDNNNVLALGSLEKIVPDATAAKKAADETVDNAKQVEQDRLDAAAKVAADQLAAKQNPVDKGHIDDLDKVLAEHERDDGKNNQDHQKTLDELNVAENANNAKVEADKDIEARRQAQNDAALNAKNAADKVHLDRLDGVVSAIDRDDAGHQSALSGLDVAENANKAKATADDLVNQHNDNKQQEQRNNEASGHIARLDEVVSTDVAGKVQHDRDHEASLTELDDVAHKAQDSKNKADSEVNDRLAREEADREKIAAEAERLRQEKEDRERQHQAAGEQIDQLDAVISADVNGKVQHDRDHNAALSGLNVVEQNAKNSKTRDDAVVDQKRKEASEEAGRLQIVNELDAHVSQEAGDDAQEHQEALNSLDGVEKAAQEKKKTADQAIERSKAEKAAADQKAKEARERAEAKRLEEEGHKRIVDELNQAAIADAANQQDEEENHRAVLTELGEVEGKARKNRDTAEAERLAKEKEVKEQQQHQAAGEQIAQLEEVISSNDAEKTQQDQEHEAALRELDAVEQNAEKSKTAADETAARREEEKAAAEQKAKEARERAEAERLEAEGHKSVVDELDQAARDDVANQQTEDERHQAALAELEEVEAKARKDRDTAEAERLKKEKEDKERQELADLEAAIAADAAKKAEEDAAHSDAVKELDDVEKKAKDKEEEDKLRQAQLEEEERRRREEAERPPVRVLSCDAVHDCNQFQKCVMPEDGSPLTVENKCSGCLEGYVRNARGKCEKDNKCKDAGGALCDPDIGIPFCPRGFKVENDPETGRRTCVSERPDFCSPILASRAGCTQDCKVTYVNKAEIVKCSCFEGYKWNNETIKCEAEEETICEPACDEHHICKIEVHQLVRTPTCKLRPGFVVNAHGHPVEYCSAAQAGNEAIRADIQKVCGQGTNSCNDVEGKKSCHCKSDEGYAVGMNGKCVLEDPCAINGRGTKTCVEEGKLCKRITVRKVPFVPHFECRCRPGQSVDTTKGNQCRDQCDQSKNILRCAVDNKICKPSYSSSEPECACREGYDSERFADASGREKCVLPEHSIKIAGLRIKLPANDANGFWDDLRNTYREHDGSFAEGDADLPEEFRVCRDSPDQAKCQRFMINVDKFADNAAISSIENEREHKLYEKRLMDAATAIVSQIPDFKKITFLKLEKTDRRAISLPARNDFAASLTAIFTAQKTPQQVKDILRQRCDYSVTQNDDCVIRNAESQEPLVVIDFDRTVQTSVFKPCEETGIK